MNAAKTIYTYYEDLYPNSQKILDKFLSAWQGLGYFVNVLRPTMFAKARCEKFDAKVATYPTVNARDYEAACYRRWPHFEAELDWCNSTGAWMMDYDILPSKTFNLEALPVFNSTTSFCHIACCYWTREDVSAFVHLLQSYRKDRLQYITHMSDMTIFHDVFQVPLARCAPWVTEYPNLGGDLIHFCGSDNKDAMLAY